LIQQICQFDQQGKETAFSLASPLIFAANLLAVVLALETGATFFRAYVIV